MSSAKDLREELFAMSEPMEPLTFDQRVEMTIEEAAPEDRHGRVKAACALCGTYMGWSKVDSRYVGQVRFIERQIECPGCGAVGITALFPTVDLPCVRPVEER